MTFSSLQRETRRDPPLESPIQLALIAGVVWLVGVVFNPLAILATIGVVLLIVAGLAYIVRPRKRTMFWRGREIELDNDLKPAERLYYAVFKR